jgi:DNA polymerase elongation subunit (family B)
MAYESVQRKKKVSGRMYAYCWYVDPFETDTTIIRTYGLDVNGQTICLSVTGFTPYAYVELPDIPGRLWTTGNAQRVASSVRQMMGVHKPLSYKLVMKHRLYGAHMTDDGVRRKFPYLFMTFACASDIRRLEFGVKRGIRAGDLGRLDLKVHEADANEILQLASVRRLASAGWLEFAGYQIDTDRCETTCDREYTVKYTQLCPVDDESIVHPNVLSFDIEVNSDITSAMPSASRPTDCIFQISCVMSKGGELGDKSILTLGDPDQSTLGDDINIVRFRSEGALIDGFSAYMRTHRAHVVTGYNIMGFDIPYIIDRAALCFCSSYRRHGWLKDRDAVMRTVKWTSAAHGTQEFKFIDAEGLVYIDLMPVIKRNYKLGNYKLKTVAEHFIGDTKDPLSVADIFKCYRVGTQTLADGTYAPSARKAMALVGKYCVQDSALVSLVFEKIQLWAEVTGMANTCGVSIFTLYTKGEQIKVYSQVYRYCTDNDIVVEKDGYAADVNDRYVGAYVFPPDIGRHTNVVPFDFASLYPTTIIAYNIDYHTWVPPHVDNVPDTACHVMEWDDHVGCAHDPTVVRIAELDGYLAERKGALSRARTARDKAPKTTRPTHVKRVVELVAEIKPYSAERSELVKTLPKHVICAKRRYRFLKSPPGVLPTIIKRLLDARARTRTIDIVEQKEALAHALAHTPNDSVRIRNIRTLIASLNKRQLAFKISANSMYGAMGVRRGYLPFMPGAMCTTYMGRRNIERVAHEITTNYDGYLVYGDTDSNYITFPKMNGSTIPQLWDHAMHVAHEITQLFPDPIVLEFEEAIYTFFFIVSKKRYMYREITTKMGDVSTGISTKGGIIVRRDNSNIVRTLYEDLIVGVADDVSSATLIDIIVDRLNSICAYRYPYTDFVMTKSVGDYSLTPSTVVEDGVSVSKLGVYATPKLETDPDARARQFKRRGVETVSEFYLRSLPAQVQLAHRMKGRGVPVATGSRIEYVVTDPENHTAQQHAKIEDADYYAKFAAATSRLDFFYYIHAAIAPVDQLLDAAHAKDPNWTSNLVARQYTLRYKVREPLMRELRRLTAPTIIVDGD